MLASYVEVLRLLCDRLGEGVTWAVTGSVGMALQGIPVEPHDIDLQTDAAGAYEIQRRLAEYSVQPVAFLAGERMRSHFGRLVIEGIQVEIMGDIEKRLSDGAWDPPPDLLAIIRHVVIADRRIPVLDLAYEVEAYDKIGRHAQADRLRQWLAP